MLLLLWIHQVLSVNIQVSDIDSVFAMEESVIQQHLTHYKQATETAREELAVLQAKYNNLQSQVIFTGNSGCFGCTLSLGKNNTFLFNSSRKANPKLHLRKRL